MKLFVSGKLVVSAIVLFFFNNSFAAVAPVEIIQPRAGLDANNRFYRAYPGLVYNVQVAAIGGVFPNQYRLDNAPAGMTISQYTGVINWPNPTESGSPHSVSVTVTDSSGGTASVSWSIQVAVNGFRFLDALNGKTTQQGGTGTLSNPWRSIADWYVAKNDATYRNVFLYYRNGTYRTNEAPIEDGYRLALPGNKPLVWLAYPGESPAIDVTQSHIAPYGGGCSNLYFEGLTITNFTTNFGVRIDSNADNITFRKNIFRNLPVGSGGSGTNASAIMISNGGAVGNYFAIIDNEIKDFYGQGFALLGYYTNKVLVQGNRISNFTVSDSKGVGPKMNNTHWYIRDNRIDMSSGQGIWIDTYIRAENIEISYNLIKVNELALWIGQEPVTYGYIESYRNTYFGGGIRISNINNSTGPINFRDDIMVYNSSSLFDTPGNASSTNRIVTNGLLNGGLTSGILDSQGDLTGAYVSQKGLKGYQQSGGSIGNKPAAPRNLRSL